ncbi:MAG: ANTAR domain-containing protein [Nocardioidaceae bacterium]
MRQDEVQFERRLRAAMKSRPIIDQAKGVLIGTQCESPEAAFAELKYVSEQHNLKVATVAEAVVEFAAGREVPDPTLADLVRREWGSRLARC